MRGREGLEDASKALKALFGTVVVIGVYELIKAISGGKGKSEVSESVDKEEKN